MLMVSCAGGGGLGGRFLLGDVPAQPASIRISSTAKQPNVHFMRCLRLPARACWRSDAQIPMHNDAAAARRQTTGRRYKLGPLAPPGTNEGKASAELSRSAALPRWTSRECFVDSLQCSSSPLDHRQKYSRLPPQRRVVRHRSGHQRRCRSRRYPRTESSPRLTATRPLTNTAHNTNNTNNSNNASNANPKP